jgi:hypothetical protein
MPFEKIDLKKVIDDELKDPEFKFYYEKISREYDLIEQLVALRKRKRLHKHNYRKLRKFHNKPFQGLKMRNTYLRSIPC